MIINGDCVEEMKKLDDNSVDSIVTDPPYLLNFMGKEWDRVNSVDPSFGNYIAGLVDGEGCFMIHKVRGGDYYECHFSIKMRKDDKAILEKIKEELGFGLINDVAESGTSKPAAVYKVNKKEDCFKLAEFFLKFPLRAKKQRDFFKWYEALLAWKYQTKGNRWHGKPDVSAMEQAYEEMKKIREYTEKPMPVNRDEFFHYLWAREALRVLKPGGHLIAFSGTRTYHRMACAIEDAGFEIRDQMQWIYGSGMPHGQDVSKAIDKKLGKTREVIGQSHNGSGAQPNKLNNHAHGDTGIGYADGSGKIFDITAPASDEAKQWSGWNTHLKPSCEPIVLARKPLSEKTVADNVMRWGTGGINIDDSRVAPQGRFPANVLFDESAAAILDEQSGTLTSGKVKPEGFVGKYTGNIYGKFANNSIDPSSVYGDSGGASRFFYCSKASKRERGEGNVHPTVKPLKLMEYLVTLVTPPNGTVLDPFAGSGTTGIAAKNKGFNFVGIEQDEHYCDIARRRIG